MKKIFTMVLLAAATVACSSNTYKIKGRVTPTEDLKDAIVLMQDIFSGKVDTAMIVGGNFTFEGVADPNTVKAITLSVPGPRRALFVPEAGNIIVDLDSIDCVKAGKLTDGVLGFLKGIREAGNNEEAFMGVVDSVWAANKTNGVGMFVLSQILPMFESEEELDEYLDGAADFIVNNEAVIKEREALKAVSATAAGQPFKEIPGVDAAGKPLKLSDFAGKGKYVLIDFWASWCGPCRREIPFLIDVDKKYAAKNVQVLGINVWDQEEPARKAVGDLGITYPVIFTSGSAPTDDYGVQGIPQILLIGPDGTILERNLRGEGISAAIDKYIN